MNDNMPPSQLKSIPASMQPGKGRQANRMVRIVAIAVAVVLALLGGLAAYETLNRDASPQPVAKPAPLPPSPTPPVAVESVPPPVPAVAELPKVEPESAPITETRPPAAVERPRADGAAPRRDAEPRQRGADKPHPVAAAPALSGLRPDTRASSAPGAWFVQAGVFNNLANAEAMRDKLTSNGFPALLEVRVLAGPYPDRGEAVQAQRRLGDLGIAPTILVPARKSPSPPAAH